MVKRHIETYDLLREPSDGIHRIIGKIDFQAIHLECEAEERRRFSSEPDEERAKPVHFRRLSPSTIQTRWLIKVSNNIGLTCLQRSEHSGSNQSDYKRKHNASLDPDERAAITERQLKSRKLSDAQGAPEEVYQRNQEHLWTAGWSSASRHRDTMLRIDALGREGKYQALTQVALEDVCDSSWKGGHNPARKSRDQLHSQVLSV